MLTTGIYVNMFCEVPNELCVPNVSKCSFDSKNPDLLSIHFAISIKGSVNIMIYLQLTETYLGDLVSSVFLHRRASFHFKSIIPWMIWGFYLIT